MPGRKNLRGFAGQIAKKRGSSKILSSETVQKGLSWHPSETVQTGLSWQDPRADELWREAMSQVNESWLHGPRRHAPKGEQ